MQTEPNIAFAVDEQHNPGLEIRVNFGVFSGRAATPAEIDRLAEWLLDEVGEVSIIAEERHERDALERALVARADSWARTCIAERPADVAEL